MKIIHINDKLEVAGGVEVYIRDVLTELRARSIDAHWVALRRRGDVIEATSKDPSFEWSGPIAEFARSPIAAAVDDETLFHVNSLSEPAILGELFKLAPVVRHMHEPRLVCPGQGKFWAKSETICTQPFGVHCFYHAYSQRCCNRHPKRLWRQFKNTRYETTDAATKYSAIIANSGFTEREALLVGLPAEKVHLIRCFTHVTPEPNWDAPQDPVIVFAGRLSRTKGVHLLLDAFAEVRRKMPEARLEILGSGHDEDLFFQQAEALGLGDSVQFLGWSDKAAIDAHLSRAAVVAFPSIYPEAFGITGIEAMMRGKPVVAFDVGGVTDWLENRRTGLSLHVGDTAGFAEALVELLVDDGLRVRLGRAARRKALDDFSADTHMVRILQMYGDVIEARAGGTDVAEKKSGKTVE